jgi:hypothetical protein
MPQFLVPVIQAIATAVTGAALTASVAGAIAYGAPSIGSLVIKKRDPS